MSPQIHICIYTLSKGWLCCWIIVESGLLFFSTELVLYYCWIVFLWSLQMLPRANILSTHVLLNILILFQVREECMCMSTPCYYYWPWLAGLLLSMASHLHVSSTFQLIPISMQAPKLYVCLIRHKYVYVFFCLISRLTVVCIKKY